MINLYHYQVLSCSHKQSTRDSTEDNTLLFIGGECISLGDLPGDDGGGVKGTINSSDTLVLNKFL